jgi:hypothetical protein|tara:strand:- start:1363 stop:1491 length:129 start_codon:yes stop_codon:yes gene_type:complete
MNKKKLKTAINKLERRIAYGNKLLKTKSLFQVIQIMKTKKDI